MGTKARKRESAKAGRREAATARPAGPSSLEPRTSFSESREIVFVTGGARSGKSRFAQSRAEPWAGEGGGTLLYIATGEARDEEMRTRIEKHRRDRGDRWVTREEPLDLAAALGQAEGHCGALLDCLTLWTSNLLERFDDREDELWCSVEALLGALGRHRGRLCVVTNEVGAGIVPDNVLGRRFRDLAGRINQEVASRATEAYLVVSGLPLRLK